LAAANKQFVNGIYNGGPKAPSVGEAVGLGDRNAIGGQIIASGILKALGMELAGGLAIGAAGSTIYQLGAGAIGSATNFMNTNKTYNDAAAACHAKYGN
jgi:hypothetical protein